MDYKQRTLKFRLKFSKCASHEVASFTSAILATENSVVLKLAAKAKLLVDRPPSASSSGSRDIHAQYRTRPSSNSIFLIY